MTQTSRLALIVALLAASVAAGAAVRRPTVTAAPPRTIVLAELFTSEGCSSCPPADTLLRRLIETQPIEGVEIVALGHHVDYWDQDGWRDPFSSALFSARQTAYDDAVFHSNQIYTPQLVIDGSLECVASDEATVHRLVLDAARRPKGSVDLTATTTSPGADSGLRVDMKVQLPPAVPRHGVAELVLAITEDGLTSQVQRGENRGRALTHGAVVRWLKTAGRVNAADGVASASTTVTLNRDWRAANIRIVGFVQEQGSRRILAAGATTLGPHR